MTSKILIRGLYTGRYGYFDEGENKYVMYKDDKGVFEKRENVNWAPERWKVLEVSNPEFFLFYRQYFNPKESESYIVIDDTDVKLLLENDK